MNSLVNGPFREAAHPQHAFFQLVNVTLEMPFHRLRPHPNLPVMYASVRGSLGIVNICGVGLNSTSSPFSMKAVESLTRAACCILCVTITSVQLLFRSKSSSSI